MEDIMQFEIKCFKGLRRIIKKKDTECWKIIFSDSDGVIEENHIVFLFKKNIVDIIIFTNFAERYKDVELVDHLLGIISYTENYEITIKDNINSHDYRPEDLIEMANEI